MAKVVLNNVCKKFGEKTILDDINLEIQDKEFVVLVGASGCGKSTLLRIIAGLEKPTSGEVIIGSKCVNNVLPKDRNIAMVFQSYALYPHLNVYDNMAFGLKVRKTPKCEIKRRVLNAADILGLEEYLYHKPKELSGGQRQRVALGRAIVREPQVFLMDEPLSNLDAKLRVQMRSEIKKLHKKLKTTFIYVTHDQTEAMTMGDKIVVLNEGHIQQIGSANEIYNNPKNTFVAGFMGAYPTNLYNAKLENGLLSIGNIFVNLKNTNLKYPEGNCDIIAGVRVEDFEDKTSPKFGTNLIKFSAKIDFEETLGAKKIVYFNLNGVNSIAQIPSDYTYDTSVEFSLDPNKIKLFDAKTKEAIV